MDSLIITEYCSSDKRKYRFRKEISEDPLINQYISNDLALYLDESEGIQSLRIGHTYIISEERKLIGIIRLAYLDSDGTLNLHYGVHPDSRKKHYGSRILQETPKYIFKQIPDVKRIELHIKEINKGSIQCAENANFILQREYGIKQSENIIKVYEKKR